jgi:hypothetical protein
VAHQVAKNGGRGGCASSPGRARACRARACRARVGRARACRARVGRARASSSALAIGRMRTTLTRPRFPFGAGRRVRFRPQTRRWRRRYACHACDDLRGQSLAFATRGTHTARGMAMKAPPSRRPLSDALALAPRARPRARTATRHEEGPPLPTGPSVTRRGTGDQPPVAAEAAGCGLSWPFFHPPPPMPMSFIPPRPRDLSSSSVILPSSMSVVSLRSG